MCYLIRGLCTKWNGCPNAPVRSSINGSPKTWIPRGTWFTLRQTKEEGDKRMKFLTLLSLLALVAVSPLTAQEKPKRLPGRQQLVGPVHTVRDEQTDFINKDGQLVEGPRILVVTFTFSEDGTKQERVFYHPESGQIIHRYADTYDPDGRVQEESVLNAQGDLETRTVYVYGEDKRLSERVTYRKDGSLANRTVFRRDGKQSSSESVSYDLRGNVIAGSTTTNDLKNKTAEARLFNGNGSTNIQSSLVNGPDGGYELKEQRSDGNFKHEVFKPEGKDQSSRVIYNADGTIKFSQRYLHEYDSYGNIIKTTRLQADGDSKDFHPIGVSYRTITYYEKK
jgi:hypothetical protein